MKEYEFNPGHYLVVPGAMTLAEGIKAARAAGARMDGALVRYPWAVLEPEPEQYDASVIGKDLTLAAEQGMRLLPMVADKTFSAKDPKPLPAYLQKFNVPSQAPNGGWTTVRWDTGVRLRMAALVQWLYRTHGQHLALEGIALQETAPSMSAEDLKATGYAPRSYGDLYIELAAAASAEANKLPVPKKRLFWHANFFANDRLGAEIERVLSTVNDIVAVGGPDNWPYNAALQERAYPIYRRATSRKRFIGMSKDSYNQRDEDNKLMPLQHVAMFGRDSLGASYLLWALRGSAEGWSFKDAVPIINAMPLA